MVLAAEIPCECTFATKFASECECDGVVHSAVNKQGAIYANGPSLPSHVDVLGDSFGDLDGDDGSAPITREDKALQKKLRLLKSRQASLANAVAKARSTMLIEGSTPAAKALVCKVEKALENTVNAAAGVTEREEVDQLMEELAVASAKLQEGFPGGKPAKKPRTAGEATAAEG